MFPENPFSALRSPYLPDLQACLLWWCLPHSHPCQRPRLNQHPPWNRRPLLAWTNWRIISWLYEMKWEREGCNCVWSFLVYFNSVQLSMYTWFSNIICIQMCYMDDEWSHDPHDWPHSWFNHAQLGCCVVFGGYLQWLIMLIILVTTENLLVGLNNMERNH